jgi:hypothetical protein
MATLAGAETIEMSDAIAQLTEMHQRLQGLLVRL